MSHQPLSEYYRDQASVLRRQLTSQTEHVRMGAIDRIRRHDPRWASMPDNALVPRFRLSHALAVIAKEQGAGEWRAFLASLGEQASGESVSPGPNTVALDEDGFDLLTAALADPDTDPAVFEKAVLCAVRDAEQWHLWVISSETMLLKKLFEDRRARTERVTKYLWPLADRLADVRVTQGNLRPDSLPGAARAWLAATES